MPFKLLKRIYDNLKDEKKPSAFVWEECGFLLKIDSEIIHVQWFDIETIFGYKSDCITFDEICIDIFTAQGVSLTISDSVPGWEQFNNRLIDNIGDIPKDWIYIIAAPAFATNMTLLFDSKKRTKQQAEAELYK